MQAYRLEMGTKLKIGRKENLYEFWGETLTNELNKELEDDELFINLASNEYFKVVKPKALKAQVITPVFKDWKIGQYKIISFYAKKARGLMAAYVSNNKLSEAEQLKAFDSAGYGFDAELSTDKQWVFTRRVD